MEHIASGHLNIRISRDEIATAVQRVQGIVAKQHAMPHLSNVLSNVLLEAKQDGVTVTATDLEIGLRGSYQATVREPGSVTLPACKMFELLKELPDGDIELAADKKNCVTIVAGRSRFTIAGLSSDSYPILPAIEQEERIPVTGSELLEMIRKSVIAVKDSIAHNPVMGGLLVALCTNGKKKTMRLVGTDGHRLAVAEREVAHEGTEDGAEYLRKTEAVIPKKAAQEICRLLEDGYSDPFIGLTKNILVVKTNGLAFTSRLMDGKYPDYRRVIPLDDGHGKFVTVSQADLKGALRRVSVMSQNDTQAVKLSVASGRMMLATSHSDYGEATEEIGVQYEGTPLTITFNAHYLLDALNVMDGESVSMQIRAEISPCLIHEPGKAGFLYVVMPIKN
jgi:DNA polymerase-3 subunit beta